MDNFEDPSNLIVGEELLAEARLMAEEKKNKLDDEKENELNEHIDGSNKRRRPSEDSKKKIYRNVRRPRSLLVKSNPTEEVGLPERTRNLQKKG